MPINGVGTEFSIRIAGSRKKTIKKVSKGIAELLGMKKTAKVKKANRWEAYMLSKKKRFSSETTETFNSENQKRAFLNIIKKRLKGDLTISLTPKN